RSARATQDRPVLEHGGARRRGGPPARGGCRAVGAPLHGRRRSDLSARPRPPDELRPSGGGCARSGVIPDLLEIVATLATGLFTGAALFVSVVEHPARLTCGPAVAIREFRPSYRRASVLQASLALIGALAALGRFAVGGRAGWLVGGLLLG